MLSSASKSLPRNIWPEVSSRVQTWPWASLRSFIGIPILPIVYACFNRVMGKVKVARTAVVVLMVRTCCM